MCLLQIWCTISVGALGVNGPLTINLVRARTQKKNAHKQPTVTNRSSCITRSAIPDESISTAFIMLKCNSWIGNKFPAFLFLLSFINFFVYFLCDFIHRVKLFKAFLLHFGAVKAGLFSVTTEWAWNQILMSNTILASHINETKNIEGGKKVIIMPLVAPPDAWAVCLCSAAAAEMILVSDSGLSMCVHHRLCQRLHLHPDSITASATWTPPPQILQGFYFSQMPEHSAAIQHKVDCAGREVWYGNKIMHLVNFQNNNNRKKNLFAADCISLYNTTIPHTYHYQKTSQG